MATQEQLQAGRLVMVVGSQKSSPPRWVSIKGGPEEFFRQEFQKARREHPEFPVDLDAVRTVMDDWASEENSSPAPQSAPRALRKEFDGLRPIREPIVYRKPAKSGWSEHRK